MQKQGSTTSGSRPSPPWSPLVVTVIAFLLPPGGAILAVRSMARIRGEQDSGRALREVVATVVVFTIGLTILATTAQSRGGDMPKVSPGASTVITVGTAVACYLILRPAYAEWRGKNPSQPPGSLLSAVGNAILFTLITVFAAAVLAAIVIGVSGTAALVGAAS